MTLTQAIELFLNHLTALNRSPETIRTYKGHLKKFNSYLCEKYNCAVYVDGVKPDDFEKYLYEPPNDKNFTQMTRQGITVAFKSFYTFCYLKGYCKTNISKKVAHIKARAKERSHITEDELFRIINSIEGETERTLIQTLFYAGLRIGEAMNLTLDDINFKDNYLYIKKHKSITDRKVPISIKLRFILENYLEYHREENGTNKVFTLKYCHSRTHTHINEVLKQAVIKQGMNINISSHIMRHSFASNLIAKGVDIVRIQKLLGHESVRTTSIYLHANMQALKKAVSTL